MIDVDTEDNSEQSPSINSSGDREKQRQQKFLIKVQERQNMELVQAEKPSDSNTTTVGPQQSTTAVQKKNMEDDLGKG